MPEPNDLVQVLKQESTAKGGDSADADDFLGYEQIDENDDGLSAAGYYAQETQGTPARDKDVLIWREGGVWKGKDNTYGTVDLLASAAGGDDKKVKVSSGDTTPGFLEAKVVAGNAIDTETLNPAGDEKLEISVGLRRSFLLMGA